jgi:hypothetical protein
MTTDINGTIIGIQGNPVVAETLGSLEDGYVLTWDNSEAVLSFKYVNIFLIIFGDNSSNAFPPICFFNNIYFDLYFKYLS